MAQLTGSGPGDGTNYAMVSDKQELWGIPRSDTTLEIARDNISGINFVHKFGRNPNIDNAPGIFEVVWNGGGDYTGFDPIAPEIIEVFSSSTADASAGIGARTLTLPRLLNGNYVMEDDVSITLNGTTSVYTTGSYLRCSRAIINTAGTSGVNIGAITIRQSGTTANIFAIMPGGYNQTMIGCDTIPSGTTGYMTSWFASLSAKKTGVSNIRLLFRPSGGVFNVKEEFAITTVGNSYVHRTYDVPKNILIAKTDIKVMSDSNVNDQGIAAGFDIIFVDDK